MTYRVQFKTGQIWPGGDGKYLEGPRDAATVKRSGYGLTTAPVDAWPFKTHAAAKLKARIVARHFSLPDSAVIVATETE